MPKITRTQEPGFDEIVSGFMTSFASMGNLTILTVCFLLLLMARLLSKDLRNHLRKVKNATPPLSKNMLDGKSGINDILHEKFVLKESWAGAPLGSYEVVLREMDPPVRRLSSRDSVMLEELRKASGPNLKEYVSALSWEAIVHLVVGVPEGQREVFVQKLPVLKPIKERILWAAETQKLQQNSTALHKEGRKN